MNARRVTLLAAGWLLTSCGSEFGPVPDDKQLAVIGAGPILNSFPGISDTVNAGPITLQYNSFGSSSCNKPAGEDVVVQGGAIFIITAYDERIPKNAVCTADFRTFNRTVTVTLARGEARLRLRGLSFEGGQTPIELAKTIFVR